MADKKLLPDLIKVSILEDHLGVIDGYKYRLQDDRSMRIVAVAMYGEGLEPMLAENPTDVLILDITIPISPADSNQFLVIDAIPGILKKYPDLIILVISFHTQVVLIDKLVEFGIRGYIFKNDNESIKRLTQIIIALMGGGVYFSQGAYTKTRSSKSKMDAQKLTPRQFEVLSLCAAYPNGTSAELAGRLGVSSSTFRNVLSSAYLRLGVRTRNAAIAQLQTQEVRLLNLLNEI